MNRKLGLVILALISVGDVAGPLLTDGEHPPYWVAVAGAVLGVASLALVVPAWAGRRWPIAPLVVLRALSALSAVPAFFIGGVPASAVGLAAAIVVLTVAGTVLVASPRRAAQVRS
jgi:hypothetical protein